MNYIWAGRNGSEKTTTAYTGTSIKGATSVSSSVNYYTITKSQGAGTTLTIKHGNSSGTSLGTTQVLKNQNLYKIHYNNFMYRFYIERKEGFRVEANRIYSEINSFLGISGVTEVRYLNRYDIENVSDDVAKVAATRIFSEPQSDFCASEDLDMTGYTSIIWEYLPGQYDQRADSAAQCVQFLTQKERPLVKTAKIVAFYGSVEDADKEINWKDAKIVEL